MRHFGLLAFTAMAAMAMPPDEATAGEDTSRFSLGFSLGLKPDMASLGGTISKDGVLDTADTTLASLAYSTDKALMSDQDNLAIWHNSDHTDSSFRLMGADPVIGGSLLGLDIGANAMYELDDVMKAPIYLKAGFHYTFSVSGGDQQRVLGDAATANPTLSSLLAANGENPADYIGGTMRSTYRADWIEIPIQVGVKVPVKRPHTFAYGGIGVSFFSGGFSLEVDVDEQYANVLATHVDIEAATVTNLSPGAVQDTIDFRLGGTGLNWGVGAQAGLGKRSAVYLELNSSGTAKTVYSSALKSETRRLLTATSSQSLYAEDPEWFKRMAFPVVTSGASVRAGIRMYFF